MKRSIITIAALGFFWPFWAQNTPRYYYTRPAAQPVPAAVQSCPRCIGGRCALQAPKELPKPPVKISGEIAPKEVK